MPAIGNDSDRLGARAPFGADRFFLVDGETALFGMTQDSATGRPLLQVTRGQRQLLKASLAPRRLTVLGRNPR
jgi:hypothetical protein